ncbi:hypothetical protein [Caulobacter sp.]|uniref:hypothetical protein n=1 Tax=Caulobacter sp. TaxID=78 RepID=UPI003BA843A3
MIPFPPGDRTPSAQALEDRTAELKRLEDEVAAFRYLAVKELMLRGSYRDLLKTLDLVERLEPAPDDWRARLEGADYLGGGFDLEEAEEEL